MWPRALRGHMYRRKCLNSEEWNPAAMRPHLGHCDQLYLILKTDTAGGGARGQWSGSLRHSSRGATLSKRVKLARSLANLEPEASTRGTLRLVRVCLNTPTFVYHISHDAEQFEHDGRTRKCGHACQIEGRGHFHHIGGHDVDAVQEPHEFLCLAG